MAKPPFKADAFTITTQLLGVLRIGEFEL